MQPQRKGKAAQDAQRAFVEMADKQGRSPMPSFTHLQRAQPIVAGHEMLAYAEMLQRDKERLRDCLKRVNVSPIGAGAVGEGVVTGVLIGHAPLRMPRSCTM